MANSTTEILKDRRVAGSLAAIGASAAATAAFLLLSAAGSGGDGAPTGVGGPGGPGQGGGPGAPAAPGAPPAPGGPGGAKPASSPKPKTSFDNLPPILQGGAAGAGGAAPAGAPAGGAAGGGGAKPKPIRPGVAASGYRPDPFVSRFNFAPPIPPAYTFAVPFRLARPYTPPKPRPSTLPPELQFGPLPQIPRRVAGVLFNGSVSAILETGTPGPSSAISIVTPGQTVPSGIPDVPLLTVESITPTQLTLRAPDGRTQDVKLSGAPSLQGQGGAGVPGGPGEGPGAPPPGFGPGGPGGFGRGGRGGRPGGGFGPGGLGGAQ